MEVVEIFWENGVSIVKQVVDLQDLIDIKRLIVEFMENDVVRKEFIEKLSRLVDGEGVD